MIVGRQGLEQFFIEEFIEVKKSKINANGIFAKTKLASGQKIAYFEGYEIDHNTRDTLYLDNKRIKATGKLRYLNHSCTPNAHFQNRWLVASHDIHLGEEITIDYLATERMISKHFKCKCGGKKCRGWI